MRKTRKSGEDAKVKGTRFIFIIPADPTFSKPEQASHYQDLGVSASDWSRRVGHLLQPIRSTIQIWHESMEFLRSFLKTHFAGKPEWWSRSKCQLFSQAKRCFKGYNFISHTVSQFGAVVTITCKIYL